MASKSHTFNENFVLAAGVSIGILYWLLDSFVDAVVFAEHTLVSQLLRPEPVEVWTRLFVLVSFTAFSLYMRAILNRLVRTESAFLESEEKARAVTETATDAVIIMDAEGRVSYWNPAAERMFGYAVHDAVGLDLHRLIAPARYRDRIERGLKYYEETGDSPLVGMITELDAVRRDGSEVPVEISLSSFVAGGRRHIVGMVRDISARKRAEAEVNASRAYLQSVMDGMSEPVMVIGADYRVAMMNRAACETYMVDPGSWSPGSPVPCYKLAHNLERPCTGHGVDLCPMREALRLGHPVSVTHEHSTSSGQICVVDILASPLRATDGTMYAAVVSSRDVTTRVLAEERMKEHEARLDHLAHHDPLTGLPNRLLFADRLDVALAHAHRHRERVAVMFLDLDRFKAVNDEFGHSAGDSLLVDVSRRISACLRECDTVARLGGDEFGMVVPDVAGGDGAETVADRVLDSLRRTFTIEGRPVISTASIGIAMYPDDGEDAGTLLKKADRALYLSKDQGRDRYVLCGRESGTGEIPLL
ncbi:MAG: diguanylate cyclase [Nitrospirae bacterium]|nr:diguanylate cyclase [Nitrospirota bacterium]MBI5694524.1 diguanylate cyclase [Nitrospirota bacterium]